MSAQGDKLLIHGPRRAEPIARELIAHKPLILAVLQDEPDIVPADLPAEWHLLWDERAGIMEYDGKLPREVAEAMALKNILRQMASAPHCSGT